MERPLPNLSVFRYGIFHVNPNGTITVMALFTVEKDANQYMDLRPNEPLVKILIGSHK